MLYSKLLNIKKNKLNENFNIYINKTFKFRILTHDNKKGIKLNIPHEKIVNNSKYKGNYWYVFTDNINFSILKKYNYIVIQLLSNKNYNEFDINTDSTYTITNKNEWYKTTPGDPNCDLEFFNQDIEKFKTIQQINENLIYKISGDAELLKNKYIKAGDDESLIYIIGLYPYMINYRYSFTLDSKKDRSKQKILKDDKTYNRFEEFSHFVDSDNLDVNHRLEMIKYQLKNYFVENNLHLEEIETKLLDTQDKNEEYLKIVDNVEFKVSEYDILIDEIRKRYTTFENNLKNLKKDFSNQQETIESLLILTNDFMTIKADVKKIKEDLISAFNIISKNDEKIKENKSKIDKNKSEIDNNKSGINKNKLEIEKIISEINNIENNLEKLEIKLSTSVDDIYIKFKEIELNISNSVSKLENNISNRVFILNKYNSDFKNNYNIDKDKQEKTNINLLNTINNTKDDIKDDIRENKIENNARFNILDLNIQNNDKDINNINKGINELTNTVNKNNSILAENDNKIIEKIGQQEYKIGLIKSKINEMVQTINYNNKKNQEVNEDQNLKVESLNKKLDELEHRLNSREENKGIYSNSVDYYTACHQNNITINFMTEDKLYYENNLYLISDDYYGEKRPYYCWKVKKVNGLSSTAKLISIINANEIYN